MVSSVSENYLTCVAFMATSIFGTAFPSKVIYVHFSRHNSCWTDPLWWYRKSSKPSWPKWTIPSLPPHKHHTWLPLDGWLVDCWLIWRLKKLFFWRIWHLSCQRRSNFWCTFKNQLSKTSSPFHRGTFFRLSLMIIKKNLCWNNFFLFICKKNPRNFLAIANIFMYLFEHFISKWVEMVQCVSRKTLKLISWCNVMSKIWSWVQKYSFSRETFDWHWLSAMFVVQLSALAKFAL